jgi:hypothetical protein
MLEVNPLLQIVDPMSAWFTCGLTAPGVQRESGSGNDPT